MRALPYCLCSILLLSSCAYEGVVVEKNTRPQPFYASLGIDGSYTFLLRDRAGVVHRQLVTPEVFERYAIGDYFNDLQPGPTQGGASDGKTMRTATQPAETVHRTAKVNMAAKSSRVATHKHKARKKVTRRSKRHSPVRTVARIQPTPQIAKTRTAEILFVSVVRCR